MNEGEGEKEGGERRRGGRGGEGGEEERGRGGGGGEEERGERRRGGRGTVPSCGFLFLNLFNLFEHF